jgi:hypothetical protein
MKVSKLCLTALCSLLPLSASIAQSVPSANSNDDSFMSWLADGDSRLTLGAFASAGKAEDSERILLGRVQDKSVGYSSAFIEGAYLTPDWAGLQLGLGFHAHNKTWDIQDTYGEKYPGSQEAYLTDSFLKFNFDEASYIQAGRFNIRNIAQRFDAQYGQGVHLRYASEDFKLDIGAINKLAYFFNDYVVDFTSADDKSQWGYAEDAGSAIYFAELEMELSDNVTVNPYAYYQDNYAGWYGMDTQLVFHRNEESSCGTKVFAYYFDAQETSVVDDEGRGSFNYSINPFYHLEKWKFDLGYASFGGNSKKNSPAWGYRYFTNILYHDGGLGDVEIIDYNPLYGIKDTDIYFGRIGYHEERWSAGFSVGHYEADDHADLHSVTEMQLGGSFTVNEHASVGGRIVSIEGDERSGVVNQDVDYFELWVSYTF